MLTRDNRWRKLHEHKGKITNPKTISCLSIRSKNKQKMSKDQRMKERKENSNDTEEEEEKTMLFAYRHESIIDWSIQL